MIPLWALGVVLLVLMMRYGYLRHQLSKTEAHWLACRMRLIALGQEFGRYAFSHQGLLPVHLDTVLTVIPKGDCGYVYRPVSELALDPRLILVYDDCPRHLLMQFPRLIAGRHVLFASGKVELFAEEAVHQLIVGDNVLRERLLLPEIAFLEVRDGGNG